MNFELNLSLTGLLVLPLRLQKFKKPPFPFVYLKLGYLNLFILKQTNELTVLMIKAIFESNKLKDNFKF